MSIWYMVLIATCLAAVVLFAMVVDAVMQYRAYVERFERDWKFHKQYFYGDNAVRPVSFVLFFRGYVRNI